MGLICFFTVVERRRVCYYPSWSQYRPTPGRYVVSNIDPFLCTHLIFAFAALNQETNQMEHFDWNDDGMYIVSLCIDSFEFNYCMAELTGQQTQELRARVKV